MSDSDKPVDTTVDPTTKTRGTDADTAQTAGEREQAVGQFDDHQGGSASEQSLPTPDPKDVTDTASDPKTTTRTE